ncbi:hypothetical protein DIPPA_28040 [Diplonema papillatum]|nr:hypothetical protein DIPPA_28040 [Diplonema papillatum]
MDSLKQAEQFEEEDVLQSLKVVLNSVSRLGSKTLHGGADPAQPVSCADFVDDVLSNTSFLHEELELGVLDRRDLLQTRSDLLLAIIIVSGCAIGIHAINVLSYSSGEHGGATHEIAPVADHVPEHDVRDRLYLINSLNASSPLSSASTVKNARDRHSAARTSPSLSDARFTASSPRSSPSAGMPPALLRMARRRRVPTTLSDSPPSASG